MILKENVNISAELSELLNEHHLSSGQKVPITNQKKHLSFALYVDNKLIGGLTAKLKQGELYIHLLAVAKEYRKQGIGKRLMLAAEEKAKKLGCHHLLLTTYSYQGTHFYPKIGFNELARITDFPTQGIDKIYFIKHLN